MDSNLDVQLPFKVDEVMEAKSFTIGYRSAWFRCKVRNSLTLLFLFISICEVLILYTLLIHDFVLCSIVVVSRAMLNPSMPCGPCCSLGHNWPWHRYKLKQYGTCSR